MEIKISIKIEREVLEDIFVTALEGGSNYWYYLGEEAIIRIRSAVPKAEDAYLSSAIAKAILDHNVTVPINDAEDEEEVVGEISLETIGTRLQKMVDDGHYDILKQHMDGGGDADSADAIMQYLTMGEVVYG
jgi:hypothetical protein